MKNSNSYPNCSSTPDSNQQMATAWQVRDAEINSGRLDNIPDLPIILQIWKENLWWLKVIWSEFNTEKTY